MARDVVVALLGPRFRVAAAAPTLSDQRLLFADERRHVERAVDRRKAEFATARRCARQALAELGVPPCSLVPAADRAPRWPPGVAGAISHTDGCCVVAVTEDPAVLAVGLDIETDEPLSPELEPVVCTRHELRWLREQPPALRGTLAKLHFSAKEAAYKCQYPRTGAPLDFLDGELDVDLAAGAFRVREMFHDRVPALDRISGRFRISDGFIVSAAVWE